MTETERRARPRPSRVADVAHARPAKATTPSIMFIPGPEHAARYIGRKVSGITEMDLFRTAMAERFNVLLEGPTGPGKTSAVLAFCATEQLPFYSVSSNVGVEPSQLLGRFVPDGNGSYAWVDGGVTAVVRNGGVLLINEINFLPDRIATVLFSLLDRRREVALLDHQGEVVRAHTPPLGGSTVPCWCPDGINCPRERALLIVADMNPDYAGTRPLNAALRNRFAVQVFWNYDPIVEAALIKSATLRGLAKGIREDQAVDTPVATNMLEEFERIATHPVFGLEFAIDNFVQHFGDTEQQSVRQALKGKESALRQDYTKKQDDGFGRVMDREKSGWLYPTSA